LNSLTTACGFVSFITMLIGTCLKPFGPIDPNWTPRLSYLPSAVRTTTHCRFYREQHWSRTS